MPGTVYRPAGDAAFTDGGLEGLAYVVALVAFIAALSTAGYMIDKMAA